MENSNEVPLSKEEVRLAEKTRKVNRDGQRRRRAADKQVSMDALLEKTNIRRQGRRSFASDLNTFLVKTSTDISELAAIMGVAWRTAYCWTRAESAPTRANLRKLKNMGVGMERLNVEELPEIMRDRVIEIYTENQVKIELTLSMDAMNLLSSEAIQTGRTRQDIISKLIEEAFG